MRGYIALARGARNRADPGNRRKDKPIRRPSQPAGVVCLMQDGGMGKDETIARRPTLPSVIPPPVSQGKPSCWRAEKHLLPGDGVEHFVPKPQFWDGAPLLT
ncbi:unnamed protein product, partial [Trichogramma brassicae]